MVFSSFDGCSVVATAAAAARRREAVGSEGRSYNAASSGDGANCSNDEMAVILDVIMIA